MPDNSTLTLPKDPKVLASILYKHAQRSEAAYIARRTAWLLAWYYFNGYRRFDVYNPAQGTVTPHYLDEEGAMEFQSQDLLYAINQVAGRIQSMDLRPSVTAQSYSLGAMRDRSTAQIIADSIVSDQQAQKVKAEFAWIYSCLGFCGVTGHIQDHPTIGLTGDLEVVHPKELYPFPVLGMDYTRAAGMTRIRWVPLDFLRKVYGAEKINSNLDDMEWYEIPIGEAISYPDEITPGVVFHGRDLRSSKKGPIEEDRMGVARVVELWVEGPQGTCAHYASSSGEYLFQSQDLRSQEAYCPIGWARFMDNGTFHGCGMFDLMYSIHRQAEQLQKSLFNNVRDIDRFGVLVMPQNQMNQNMLLREVGRGLKVLFWDPDPVHEGFNPFPINPHNSGDMPGRVAQFAKESMAAINPLQDLLREKGRVDSATGLQFLDELGSRALTSPSNGVVKAWGSCYRAMTQRACWSLTSSPRSIPVSQLTLDLAGAIIDPKSLEVSFPENPLPRVSGLNFGVREASPRSPTARKQEALQLWEKGLGAGDEQGFRLFALKEGLDFALWMDEDKGAYEMSVYICLMLFGDGETNNQVVITPHTTRPELMLRVVNAFANSPTLAMASDEIINDFRQLRMTLMQFMGLTLPNAIGNPDDLAMLSAAGAGMLPQGTPGMGAGTPPDSAMMSSPSPSGGGLPPPSQGLR